MAGGPTNTYIQIHTYIQIQIQYYHHYYGVHPKCFDIKISSNESSWSSFQLLRTRRLSSGVRWSSLRFGFTKWYNMIQFDAKSDAAVIRRYQMIPNDTRQYQFIMPCMQWIPDDTTYHQRTRDDILLYQVQFYQMKSASADTAASLRDWVTAAFQTMNEVNNTFSF